MRVFQARGLEIDNALDQEVLGIFLGAGLLFNAVDKVLKDYLKKQFGVGIPEESLEVQIE